MAEDIIVDPSKGLFDQITIDELKIFMGVFGFCAVKGGKYSNYIPIKESTSRRRGFAQTLRPRLNIKQ